MKQLKELWTLVNNWLGNGKKCIIGLVFFLVGFVMNWFSHPVEGLSQIPFTLMTAGGLCLVNALFSKWTDKNINLLFFVLAFICVMQTLELFFSMVISHSLPRWLLSPVPAQVFRGH